MQARRRCASAAVADGFRSKIRQGSRWARPRREPDPLTRNVVQEVASRIERDGRIRIVPEGEVGAGIGDYGFASILECENRSLTGEKATLVRERKQEQKSGVEEEWRGEVR